MEEKDKKNYLTIHL